MSVAARGLLPEAPHDDGDADIWLLDVPYNADDWVAQARARNRPVAALDFEGQSSPDLVVSIYSRDTAKAGGRHLVGLDYAIIRPEIAKLAPAHEGAGVVVIIGGGDQDGLGARVAGSLYGQGEAVTLIEGPLAACSTDLPPDVVRLASPSDLAARMASCAWSVTSGGTAMLEMLCLGKPVHVVPRTPHEAALAKLIFERGALLGIGFETLQVSAPDVRARTAVEARSLVDGRGIERIVEAVGRLL